MMENDFDTAASTYDETFTLSQIGKLQRERVYYWLEREKLYTNISTLFEINCGTGFDAAYFTQKGLDVIATDASDKMIEVAKKHHSNKINFFQLDFRNIGANWIENDAVFSNFGGLNCVNKEDLQMITSQIAKNQSKGNFLICIIMPKFCLMESFYFLTKFKFGKMFRRNKKGGLKVNVEGKVVETFYHSPRELKKMLKIDYQIRKIRPIAFFLPPSYLESFFKNKPRILNFLNKLEVKCSNFSFLSQFSDHFIIIAQKK